MAPDGPPAVKELNQTDLRIEQPLGGGGTFSIVCGETQVTCTGLDGQGQPLRWAWDLVGGNQQKSAVQKVTANGVLYHSNEANYQLTLSPGAGFWRQMDNGTIRIIANGSGKLVLNLDVRK